jgi:3-hydroxyacyl-CoA dehydrogenase/enoyl-CoA hydratase/3-hydroxybutyryl-CoA epimerase
MPWLNEAAWCLWEGYPMAALEKALKNFGMPMGPLELLDEVGLDVAGKVGHILEGSFGERAAPAPVLDKLAGAAKAAPGKQPRLGRKSGLGFYTFDKPGGRKQALDPKILEILFAGAHPSAPEFTEEGLVRRMIYPMINEAAIALEESIVSGPAQVDLAMIFGTGFPPFRGGLLRYADGIGVSKIVAELDRLAEIHGKRLKPSAALRKVADGAGRFYV